jgi:hypothetical protein
MSILAKIKNQKAYAKLQKDIQDLLKKDKEATQDIIAYGMVHYGDFKAIGDYTIKRLNIDLSKYSIADEHKTKENITTINFDKEND